MKKKDLSDRVEYPVAPFPHEMFASIPRRVYYSITKKIANMKEKGYRPRTLVLWEGYEKYIDVPFPSLKGSDIEIFGLNIILTDIKDTIEVF